MEDALDRVLKDTGAKRTKKLESVFGADASGATPHEKIKLRSLRSVAGQVPSPRLKPTVTLTP